MTVKWGEPGHLPLPSGTVVKAVDYPRMSLPITWLFHPLWGLGMYDYNENEDEDEHLSYRSDGNEIHTGGLTKV